MIKMLKNIYYKIYVTLDRIKDQLLWRSQRFIKGYATVDAWNVDYWFITNIEKILKEIKEKNDSIPGYFLEDVFSQQRDPTKEEKDKAWNEWMSIIDRMIELIEIMKKDPDSEEEFYYIDKCKDEFFKLFSKYFWMLGY